MTADLKEAFHVAAVECIDWRRWNEEQAQWGRINSATGRREYWPEPTVVFFGRPFTLTEICRLARVLSGPLPPHVRVLFRVIDDGIGEPIPENYGEAVGALDCAIGAERERQTDQPIEEPLQVDRIRDRAIRDGAAAAFSTLRQEAEKA